MSKQDNTLASDRAEDVIQIGIRIPVELYKAVAHEVAERGPGSKAQDLWIEAMRSFLNLKQ